MHFIVVTISSIGLGRFLLSVLVLIFVFLNICCINWLFLKFLHFCLRCSALSVLVYYLLSPLKRQHNSHEYLPHNRRCRVHTNKTRFKKCWSFINMWHKLIAMRSNSLVCHFQGRIEIKRFTIDYKISIELIISQKKFPKSFIAW